MSGSDVVILAVKPDVIPSVLREIDQHLSEDSLIISIAAGVPLSVLEQVGGLQDHNARANLVIFWPHPVCMLFSVELTTAIRNRIKTDDNENEC